MITQEIDTEYLNTLPEGVREDVIEKMNAKDESQKPLYRAASTMIDKDINVIGGVFGANFFDTMQSSYMPINEPNLDSSYILDYGDALEVQMVGAKNSSTTYNVKRDGTINVAEVGRINVSGLSFDQANLLIKSRIENSIMGVEAYVSLVNIRDIQVIVSGNAYNPGIYTLSGNSNLLYALTMAGGIDDNGSYRSIKLIRNNEVIEVLDLYELFIDGKSSINKRLKSGDSIVIEPVNNLVNVNSGVKRPGLYELKKDETFQDLVNYANGIASNANLDIIQYQRADKNNINTIEIEAKDLQDIIAKDDDILSISEYKYGTVRISGAIKIPGSYKIASNDTLKDLIVRAGGYEDYAYPFGGFLNNQRTISINDEAKEKLYDQFIKNFIEQASNSSASAFGTSFPLILEELRSVKPVGRVIAEFDLDVLEAKPEFDTVLENGDEIIIPINTNQVYIYGEVSNQGSIRYRSNQDINYYIENSGGLLPSADRDTIFVVYPNGQTKNLTLKNNRLSFLSLEENDISIFPGSIIYIPKSAAISSRIQTISVWAPILSSLALSLASVSSLNN